MVTKRQIEEKISQVTARLQTINPQVSKLEQDFYTIGQNLGRADSGMRGIGAQSQHALNEFSKSMRRGKELQEAKGREWQDMKNEQKRLSDKLLLLQAANKLWKNVESYRDAIRDARAAAPTISREVADEREDDARTELRLIQTRLDKVNIDEESARKIALRLIREGPLRNIERAKANAATALSSGNRDAYLTASKRVNMLTSQRSMRSPGGGGGARVGRGRMMNPKMMNPEFVKLISGDNVSMKKRTVHYTSGYSFDTISTHTIHSAAEHMRSEGRIPEAEALEAWEKIALQKNELESELHRASTWHTTLSQQKQKLDAIPALEEELERLTQQAEEASVRALDENANQAGGKRRKTNKKNKRSKSFSH